MTWRRPPFDAAADDAVAYVERTYAPLGVVLAGSIVRGEGDVGSDLDVVVVHALPWRLREQKRFAGVPAELFVNPPSQIRRYFAEEHAEGRPSTAHMLATGEIVRGHPIVDELVGEARTSLARPLEVSAATLVARRYGIVDTLDDARDVLERDPAAAALLIGAAVRDLVELAFLERGLFLPRRKAAVAALAALDPRAAELVRQSQASAAAGVEAASELARRVIGTDTFFEWTSDRAPVE